MQKRELRLTKYLVWCLYAPISWLLVGITWLIAPILAIDRFVVIESGREWLIKPLRLFQTLDHPLDHWNYGGYGYVKSKYLARLLWLWRNPAYGFNQTCLSIKPIGTKQVRSKGKWDSDTSNITLILFDNCFQIYGQLYYFKRFYLRLNIGWKDTGFERRTLATHLPFNPFRVWKNTKE